MTELSKVQETLDTFQPLPKDPVRLTHSQRLQLKETTAKKEVLMKVQKNVWYWRWRMIYQDEKKERVEIVNKRRDQLIRLMDFE